MIIKGKITIKIFVQKSIVTNGYEFTRMHWCAFFKRRRFFAVRISDIDKVLKEVKIV